MESNLSPGPSNTTNTLLTQLLQIGLGNLAKAGLTPAAPASTWSPSTPNIRIQTIAYASLSMSLLAAFGAALCKQWLGYCKSNKYGRGSPEKRGKRNLKASSLDILMPSCNPFRSSFRSRFFSLGSPSAPTCGMSSIASSEQRSSDFCSIR
ncbi:uncharacterized protein EDB91DRAFT_645533 [Suillus paluster]|uniref:uncharacterized protein n=1 Tax=Suillus paluster TaxID=48578 RepID=UPI001B870F0B|nr:uncharacterized protein EDB91DRAFT_645533 [Suillus paluster]KAG1733193.1 hypothetical protein EDB91DRAFT_645533 [Suillus paluster]